MNTHQTTRNFAIGMFSKAFCVSLFILFGTINLFADHHIEVTGKITSLGADFLVVQGNTFFVDQNTELKGHGNDHITFSFFQVNDLVRVVGEKRDDGTYLATRIESEVDHGMGKDLELSGFVTALGSNSFVIQGDTIFVDANTEFSGHEKSFSFAQIEVGMLLEVKAVIQSNGNFLATRIKTEDDHHQQHDAELEVTGNIENITGNSFIIGQRKFFVDNQTVILNEHGILITFSDLKVGNKVEVKAFRQPDSTYLASNIKLEGESENEIEITAQIGNITDSDIVVNGITFTTDSNTVFLDNNRMPVTLSDLSIGMFVEIKGLKNPDGSFYASRVKIEDFVRSEIEIRGTITELDTSSLIVNGITFSVDSTTKVFGDLNNPIKYTDLQTGQLVEIKGVKTGTLTAKALRIKVEGNNDLEIFGKITAINQDNFELNGFKIFVNGNTLFFNPANQSITFADLKSGQFVEVKMVRNPDSTLTALSVKIEDDINFSKVAGFASIVSGSSIQLSSGTYAINNQTVVIDNNFNLITANQLSSGQQVIVWAKLDALSNKTALQIQSEVTSPTSVKDNAVSLNNFVLEQNYPNPFNPSTVISFTIQADQFVTLKVFNALGQEVRTLINTNLTKGTHNITFDASKLTSGFYLYRLESGNNVQVKKMLLLK